MDVPGNTPGGLMTSHKYITVYNIPEGVHIQVIRPKEAREDLLLIITQLLSA